MTPASGRSRLRLLHERTTSFLNAPWMLQKMGHPPMTALPKNTFTPLALCSRFGHVLGHGPSEQGPGRLPGARHPDHASHARGRRRGCVGHRDLPRAPHRNPAIAADRHFQFRRTEIRSSSSIARTSTTSPGITAAHRGLGSKPEQRISPKQRVCNRQDPEIACGDEWEADSAP